VGSTTVVDKEANQEKQASVKQPSQVAQVKLPIESQKQPPGYYGSFSAGII